MSAANSETVIFEPSGLVQDIPLYVASIGFGFLYQDSADCDVK